LKCPYCGGNPVVFDPELQAYVCSHCGAVIEEHPVEYRLPSREKPNVSRDDVRRTRPLYKMRDWLTRLVEDQCRQLGLSKYLCLQVKRRVATAVQEIVREEGVKRLDARKFKLVIAACIYTILLEHGSVVSLKKLSRQLGLEEGRVFTALYKYKDEIGFRHVDKTVRFIPTVVSALRKQLSEEDAERVRSELLRLASKLPHSPRNPLYHVAVLAVAVARRLGLKVEVERLGEDLGFTPSQINSMYTRVKELDKRVREFEEAGEKSFQPGFSGS
jgi:transcription initiation factor TFIIIB Brf1 subunit/transcription initiation factor TFIIB